jgi:hypothetical protein
MTLVIEKHLLNTVVVHWGCSRIYYFLNYTYARTVLHGNTSQHVNLKCYGGSSRKYIWLILQGKTSGYPRAMNDPNTPPSIGTWRGIACVLWNSLSIPVWYCHRLRRTSRGWRQGWFLDPAKCPLIDTGISMMVSLHVRRNHTRGICNISLSHATWKNNSRHSTAHVTWGTYLHGLWVQISISTD